VGPEGQVACAQDIQRKEVRVVIELLVWLVKFPFVLVAAVLAFVFGLVGGILALLGVILTPVLGIGLLILPIGLAFLLAAGLLVQLFKHKRTIVVYR
jgi:hypothetical protein